MAQRPSYALISRHESFSHERLRLAENSIRLFQVQPGGRDDSISLRITQYAAHRRPSYVAISYTWGSTTNLCEILVNGRAFKIHYNLWNLLVHLRLRKETTFLWADALCIDQANLRERNFHVQLMGNIYEQAKSVIVWLGIPSPDRTEIRAIDFIKDLNIVRKSHGSAEVAKIYLVDGMRHRWETLLRMCQHTYWTRTWIVQEFLRAPEVEVVSGSVNVDWGEFEDVLLMIQNTPFNKHDCVLQILQSRPTRLTLRRRARTASTLHELLGEYHDSSCTEQRDKVYGILGLASDCGQDEATGRIRGMIPDYNKHIVEVYLDAVACIEKSLVSRTQLPSVVNLVRQTLLISDEDLADYTQRQYSAMRVLSTLKVMPEYVGVVDHVLPSWTSIRDLKTRLASIEWGQYVGYEVQTSRPRPQRRPSSRATHAAIPDDMIQNVVNVAETEPGITQLHNYPSLSHLRIASDHITLHREDKQLYDNPDAKKPCVVLEHIQEIDSLRLGMACINTRRGDLILQFSGLDGAIICREIGHDIFLVGKAFMIKNSELYHEYELDPVCKESPWLSPCLRSHNPRDLQLETDALSLAELLTRE